MNEKIKELAEQSNAFIIKPEHASIGGVPEVSFDKYKDLEKFAELIIRECSKVAMDNLDCPASAIETHFGVE